MSSFGAVLGVFSLVPLLGGVFAVYLGWGKRATSTAISEAGTTPVGDLEPGPVGVTGRVRQTSSGHAVRSPISQDEAVAYGVIVEEYNTGPGGDDGGGGGWEQIHTEWESVPFLLADGEDTVAVDPPAGAEHRYDWTRKRVNPGRDPPPAIQSYIERTEAVDRPDGWSLGPFNTGKPHRYSEGMLETGGPAYVLGTARETGASHDGPDYVIDESAGGQFILSDKHPDELMTRDRQLSLVFLSVGALFVALGVVLFLVSTLVLL
jgi:hypothetical protein